MSEKGANVERILALEESLHGLRTEMQSLRARIANSPNGQQCRPARVIGPVADDDNVFDIIFLDGDFPEQAGAQPINWDDRQSEARHVCHNVAGPAPTADEIVLVFRGPLHRWYTWWRPASTGTGGVIPLESTFDATEQAGNILRIDNPGVGFYALAASVSTAVFVPTFPARPNAAILEFSGLGIDGVDNDGAYTWHVKAFKQVDAFPPVLASDYDMALLTTSFLEFSGTSNPATLPWGGVDFALDITAPMQEVHDSIPVTPGVILVYFQIQFAQLGYQRTAIGGSAENWRISYT